MEGRECLFIFLFAGARAVSAEFDDLCGQPFRTFSAPWLIAASPRNSYRRFNMFHGSPLIRAHNNECKCATIVNGTFGSAKGCREGWVTSEPQANVLIWNLKWYPRFSFEFIKTSSPLQHPRAKPIRPRDENNSRTTRNKTGKCTLPSHAHRAINSSRTFACFSNAQTTRSSRVQL